MLDERFKNFSTLKLIVFAAVLIVCIVISAIFTPIYYNKNITTTNITVCLNEDTESTFSSQYNNKSSFYKYFKYETISDSKKADIVLTTDYSQINTDKEYSVEGYSPLVVALKNTPNLNNYLKSTTQKGFLTSRNSKELKNTSEDNIVCDFSVIMQTVLNGGDWSDLGGEDKKITIYCPNINSSDGRIFYDFLLITVNNGKYPSAEALDVSIEKVEAFLNSPNVIQTDVEAKISTLSDAISESDIFVIFESDLVTVAKDFSSNISVTYPDTTVIKSVYLQYNNPDIKASVSKAFSDTSDLSYTLYSYYYRNSKYKHLNANRNSTIFNNVQEGFNYYELHNE